MEGGRRRRTLYDQMLAVGESRELAGLTLNDVLTIHKRAEPNRSLAVQLHSRTLLDIIRDDDFHVGKVTAAQREKNPWKSLRNRLRVTRSHISPPNPVHSDPISPTNSGDRSPETMHQEESTGSAAAPSLRPQLSRRNSTRFSQATNDSAESIAEDAGPGRSLRPQMSRHNSTRFSVERSESFADLTEPAREGTRRLSAALAEERALSAREAVAAQEAADAEATPPAPVEVEEVTVAPPPETAAPVRMSLMDLLEETDRQMGFEGSKYRIGDDDEEEDEDVGHGGGGGGGEQNCCVCMVRHKGAAFIPCGHTFCRLCSRELWVSRGNCPLCNGFILEILDIF